MLWSVCDGTDTSQEALQHHNQGVHTTVEETPGSIKQWILTVPATVEDKQFAEEHGLEFELVPAEYTTVGLGTQQMSYVRKPSVCRFRTRNEQAEMLLLLKYGKDIFCELDTRITVNIVI